MVVARKVKTLISNPKGVYNKYILGKKNTKKTVAKNVVFTEKSKNMLSNSTEKPKITLSSPRVMYLLKKNDEISDIYCFPKMVKNQSFSTAIFLENEKIVSHVPIANAINMQNKFVSFREKTLFFADVQIESNVDIFDSFKRKCWRDLPFKYLTNAILVNPSYNYSKLIRYSSSKLNVIGYFDKKLQDNIDLDDFDMVIVNLPDCRNNEVKHKNISYCDSLDSAVQLIGECCSFNGPRAFDLFVPVFDKFQYLDDIDEINETDADVVLRLSTNYSLDELLPFDDLLDKMKDHIELVLVKETVFQKYNYYINNGLILEFLKEATKDGLRFVKI